MTFEWSTFILEVINFLVLVWLLSHFFYRPVLKVIEARQAESARIIEEAAAQRREAEARKQDYDTRLAKWAEERQAAQAQLAREIQDERNTRLAALEQELIEERSRRVVLDKKRQEEERILMERQAAALAGRFVARLMDRLADPALEAKLADLTLAELAEATPDTTPKIVTRLRAVLADPASTVRIQSAWPLDPSRRAAFAESLSRLAGKDVSPEFVEEPSLRAGISVVAGEWVLAANLRDELDAFTSPVPLGARAS